MCNVMKEKKIPEAPDFLDCIFHLKNILAGILVPAAKCRAPEYLLLCLLTVYSSPRLH